MRNEDDILRFGARIDAGRHDFGICTVVDENFQRGLVEEHAELESIAEGLKYDFAFALTACARLVAIEREDCLAVFD